MTGSMTIIVRSEDSAWANDKGRRFGTNTNVHGIRTYALTVLIRPRRYVTQNAAMTRRSEEQASAAAALGSPLASSRRPCISDANLSPMHDLYASCAKTRTLMATRQPVSAKVGSANTNGEVQKPGHTWQSPALEIAMCVKDAT